MQCLSCEQENPKGSRFCSLCGLPLPSEIPGGTATGIICSGCQTPNAEGSFFCFNCGFYFGENAGKQGDNGAGKSAPVETKVAARAKIQIPGKPDIILAEAPVFVERGSFDQTLPQDVLMSISRQHILITYENGSYYVQDFGRDGKGSTNHTRLNNNDIHHKGKQPLKDGDRIELAHQAELTLTFRMDRSVQVEDE